MELDQYLERNIMEFLDKHIEKKQSDIKDREEDYGLYLTKDYSKELDNALESDEITKAKTLFEELKSIHSRLPKNSVEKKKIYAVLEQMYGKIESYMSMHYLKKDSSKEEQKEKVAAPTDNSILKSTNIKADTVPEQKQNIIADKIVVQKKEIAKQAINVHSEKIFPPRFSQENIDESISERHTKSKVIIVPRKEHIHDHKKVHEKKTGTAQHKITVPEDPVIADKSFNLNNEEFSELKKLEDSQKPNPILSKDNKEDKIPDSYNFSNEKKSIQQLYEEGLKNMFTKRYDDAVGYFRQILEIRPGHRAAIIRISECMEALSNE